MDHDFLLLLIISPLVHIKYCSNILFRLIIAFVVDSRCLPSLFVKWCTCENDHYDIMVFRVQMEGRGGRQGRKARGILWDSGLNLLKVT